MLEGNRLSLNIRQWRVFIQRAPDEYLKQQAQSLLSEENNNNHTLHFNLILDELEGRLERSDFIKLMVEMENNKYDKYGDVIV